MRLNEEINLSKGSQKAHRLAPTDSVQTNACQVELLAKSTCLNSCNQRFSCVELAIHNVAAILLQLQLPQLRLLMLIAIPLSGVEMRWDCQSYGPPGQLKNKKKMNV